MPGKKAPNLERWPWPSVLEKERMSGVETERKRQNYLGALIVLDLIHADGDVDTDDYYLIRTGLLLSSANSASMREYLVAELGQDKQKRVLRAWEATNAE